METGFSADDRAKRVWRQTLIDTNIFLFVQLADVQVATHERVTRPRAGQD